MVISHSVFNFFEYLFIPFDHFSVGRLFFSLSYMSALC